MKKASLSILVFGIYILTTGTALLLAPSLLLKVLSIEENPNIWMNLLGLALAALGFYYIKAARDNNLDFFKGTIPIRLIQFFVVSGLVYQYNGPLVLIAISSIEFASGIYTWWLVKNNLRQPHTGFNKNSP